MTAESMLMVAALASESDHLWKPETQDEPGPSLRLLPARRVVDGTDPDSAPHDEAA